MIGAEVKNMTKDEIWGVSLPRAAAFFREQEDVTEESAGVFLFRTCRIQLCEMKSASMGIWAAKRIKVRMEGEDDDVETISRRFFLRFLSQG